MLTGGSLFSGIGGFELGAEIAGVEVDWRWQVEIDPFCRSVLERHWPHTDRSVTDVREAGSHNLEPVDVIVGGFPCQDISLAGNGAGLAGARSGLWREMARVIAEVRPRFVVVENVLALVSRGLPDVLADLAALGFDAEWCDLRASDVGAPHQRARLFLVAWWPAMANPDGGRPQSERSGRVLDGEREAQRHDADGCSGAELADPAGERCRRGPEAARRQAGPAAQGPGPVANPRSLRPQARRGGRPAPAGWPEPPGGLEWPPAPDDVHAWGRVQADAQPSVCRVGDGLPAGVLRARRHRLKAMGNAIVPHVAAVAWRRLEDLTHE